MSRSRRPKENDGPIAFTKKEGILNLRLTRPVDGPHTCRRTLLKTENESSGGQAQWTGVPTKDGPVHHYPTSMGLTMGPYLR